jgi:large subunit ribosomal protein L2
MANKVYKPTTPGRRNYSVASFEELTVNEPEKTLTKKFKSRS